MAHRTPGTGGLDPRQHTNTGKGPRGGGSRPGAVGLAQKGAWDRMVDWVSRHAEMDEAGFRRWALREAWAMATVGMPVVDRFMNVSEFADDMLRMYLRGRPDPDLLRRLVPHIAADPQFGALAGMFRVRIGQAVAARGRPLTEAELLAVCRATLPPARAFYFHGALQPVIGGMTGLDVRGGRVRGPHYTVTLTIADTYDFDNVRTDQPAYNAFRLHLYDLIRRRQYLQCRYEYDRALTFGIPDVDRPRVFASLMYAIERAGYTHPVAWQVDVPFDGDMAVGPAAGVNRPPASGSGRSR